MTSPEDWYKITTKEFTNKGGGSLLQNYNNSLPKTLINVYKNFSWLPWKFSSTPKGTINFPPK